MIWEFYGFVRVSWDYNGILIRNHAKSCGKANVQNYLQVITILLGGLLTIPSHGRFNGFSDISKVLTNSEVLFNVAIQTPPLRHLIVHLTL